MQFLRHCSPALVLAAGALCAAAAAQTQLPAPAPSPGEAAFTIFRGGVDVGREEVNLARSGSDWVITSTGRVGNLTINRFELKYTADWQPQNLEIEATLQERKIQLETSFTVTSAINEITQDGVTNSKTDQISARTVVLPNNFYAGYEALAARLSGLDAGAELPMYVAPQAEVKLVVDSVSAEQVQTPEGLVDSRRYEVTIHNIGGTLQATVTIDGNGRFARVDIPSASLSVVRTDLAGVGVRPVTARNPTDSDVRIPATGFTLAGTITTPPSQGRLRHPAIVLVAGSGPVDRDETVAGIPIFTHLAGDLAAQGFLVLRYDKRGIGQSGGRTESATLQDYADDVISTVRWLGRRRDVDSRRIVVAGHSEGGAVAMLAAARERRRISSLVLIATPGTTGAELILEQQRHQLELLKMSEEEQQEKIALQNRIHEAVATGEGWEEIPPELRRQADTPWFRSLLQFDPAAVMSRIRQPILIIQGDLDTQVVPEHARKLEELARARRRDAGVEVVHLAGVNHLLVPATSGEVQEYPLLKGKEVTEEASLAIANWLKRPD